MKVVVGSTNGPKRQAVEKVFAAAFPDTAITVERVATDSGVSSHPISADESLEGALNRAARASELAPGADYYVGIEGGLLQAAGRAWELGWVAIRNAEGKVATGLSSGLEQRGHMLRELLDGSELNEIVAKDFGIAAIGDSNGFYGLATNDLVTRQAAYEQGIAFALAQFLHPEFYAE